MSSSTVEALVELQPGATAEEDLPPDLHVLQRLPPRFVIVAASEAGVRSIEHSHAVRAVFTEDVPPEALEEYDQIARAFAAGWNERRRPKNRPGEGKSWDSPGFEAP